MREVISLQVGQCGNQMGVNYWDALLAEHGINAEGHVHDPHLFAGGDATVMFQECPLPTHRHGIPLPSDLSTEDMSSMRLVPRSILIDLEPGVLQSIQAGHLGTLFHPDYYCNSHSGAGNNWAKGHCTLGLDLSESIMDMVRKQSESSDHLVAFQLFHSLGGGTGSGLGTLLLQKLSEEYPSILRVSHSVIPSERVSESVVESYNAILSLNQLIEWSHLTTVLNNETMYDLADRLINGVGIQSLHRPFSERHLPTYSDLNTLSASVISGLSSSSRFPGQQCASLRSLATNLVVFPRLHFISAALHPCLSLLESGYHNLMSEKELVGQLFAKSNWLCTLGQGRTLTSAAILRGNDHVSVLGVATDLQKAHKELIDNNVEWVPCRMAISLSVSPRDAAARQVSKLLAAQMPLRPPPRPQSPFSPSRSQSPFHSASPMRRMISRSTLSPISPMSSPNPASESSSQSMLRSNTNSVLSRTIANSPRSAPMLSCVLLCNATGMQSQWRSILHQFSVMRSRRAFMHWYTDEGMSEMDFEECANNVRDLIGEYGACEQENYL